MGNNWRYKGKDIKTLPNCFGFTYKIWLIKDIDGYKNGTIYIGKKQLNSVRKTKISRKEKAATGNNRKKFKKVVTPMDWENYWSSSLVIKQLIEKYGNQIFRREILEFYPDKYNLSFGELKQMFLHKIYEVPTLNGTVGRYYINKLK